jgi:hypothetical protein
VVCTFEYRRARVGVVLRSEYIMMRLAILKRSLMSVSAVHEPK